MGAGESSTPCPGENEEGFQLAVHVLPCFKGHITLKAALGDAPGQDVPWSGLHARAQAVRSTSLRGGYARRAKGQSCTQEAYPISSHVSPCPTQALIYPIKIIFMLFPEV